MDSTILNDSTRGVVSMHPHPTSSCIPHPTPGSTQGSQALCGVRMDRDAPTQHPRIPPPQGTPSGFWGEGGGGWRELCAHLFSIPVIQLPGCRRRSLATASARTGSVSPPPLRGPGRASVAAAEQGGRCPRSSHSSDHLFANKTSILEASLTLGHSPS